MNQALIDSLRDRLTDYLATIGVSLRRQGNRLTGQCPVHQDRTPSFAVFGPKSDRAGCYPCGWSGDVFSFVQWTGRASTFPEAVRHVAEVLGVTVDEPQRQRARVTVPSAVPASPVTVRPSPPPPADLDLTNEEFDAAHRRSRAALFDACRRGSLRALAVAQELGTTVDVLRRLTFGSDAVGIEDGRVLYLYETGVKVRRPAGCKPRFVWTHGHAAKPWRWHFADRKEIETVFLTEGESDAIAAVGAGLEDDGRSAVVASPGTAFRQEWGALFRGKRAVLLFDRDEPGRKAAQRTAQIIAPHALRVQIARWERGNHEI